MSPFNRTDRGKEGVFLVLTDNLDLRILMESKGITQIQIAENQGVTPTTVNRWLRNPDLKPIFRNRIINSISAIESGKNRD